MPPKVENLEPLIRKILTAPGVDMMSVTAKDVRKQLVKMDSSISEEYLKEHKDEVKELITNIFHSIQEAASSKKRERDSDEDGDNSEEEEAPKPSQKKKTKTKASKSAEDDDAEIARKLSKEINGNGGRSTRQAAPPKKSAGTKRSKKKSAETINSGDEEDAPKKRAARGGFAKEYALSAPLAAVVGTDVLARTQVVKKLWEYIKANKLQNPENGKEILCDDQLRAVFSVNKIDMFKMNKAIGEHLHEKTES